MKKYKKQFRNTEPVQAPQPPTQMDQVLGGLQSVADALTNGGELVAAGMVLAGRQTIRGLQGALDAAQAEIARLKAAAAPPAQG